MISKGDPSEKTYIAMKVKESAYRNLLKLKNDLSSKIGRSVSFSDIIGVLIEAWNLLPDEDKLTLVEALRERKLGKVLGRVPA